MKPVAHWGRNLDNTTNNINEALKISRYHGNGRQRRGKPHNHNLKQNLILITWKVFSASRWITAELNADNRPLVTFNCETESRLCASPRRAAPAPLAAANCKHLSSYHHWSRVHLLCLRGTAVQDSRCQQLNWKYVYSIGKQIKTEID